MSTRSWIVFAVAVAVHPPEAAGQEPGALRTAWAEANRAYRAGAFEQAADGYRELLGEVPDPRLEANLAAALWRGGERGAALLHYRRALDLAPRNPNVRGDHERLRLELGEPPDATPVMDRLLGWMRADEALALLLIASLVGAVSMAAVSRRSTRGAIVGVLVVIVAGLALRILPADSDLAVSLVDTEVRASAGGEPIATLPEGSVVRVLERRGSSARVQTPTVPAGWVATSGIARIH